MNKECVAIVNGAAGAGRCGKLANEALAELKERGWHVERLNTTAKGSATLLARNAMKEGKRCFLSVGGDGTTYEVLNGLFPEALEDQTLRFGILPLGTGNSFLRDFGISDTKAALERFDSGKERLVDLIELRHEHGLLFFLNIFSIRFSAQVGALRNRYFKAFGHVGYAMAVLTKLASIPQKTCHVWHENDEKHDKVDYMMFSVCNSQFTGGTMHMAPDAKVDDGKFNVVHVEPLSVLDLLRTFPAIYQGRHLAHTAIHGYACKSLRFEGLGQVDVMIDGEICRLKPLTLNTLPRALRLNV
ncbi:MAG: diacylglycerol kinase family lipid kinase [Myxococcales bacterium]|nr:MAG: diacylglycerol kinase family lipid kinase [Myxococcales bacterium]